MAKTKKSDNTSSLKSSLRIPDNVDISLLDAESNPARAGDLIASINQLKCVQLPLHPLFPQFFSIFGLCPFQFHSNIWRVLSLWTLFNMVEKSFSGNPLSVADLFFFFKAFNGHGKTDASPSHYLYLQSKSGVKSFLASRLPDSDKNWGSTPYRVSGNWYSCSDQIQFDLPTTIIAEGILYFVTPSLCYTLLSLTYYFLSFCYHHRDSASCRCRFPCP